METSPCTRGVDDVGWTVTTRKKGISNDAFFRQEFGDGVLATGAPMWNEVYIAYRDVRGCTFALAVSVQWYPDGTYGYKEVEEGSGPIIAKCPDKILSLLSPLAEVYPDPTSDTYRWATEWRTRCQIYNVHIKKIRKVGRDLSRLKKVIMADLRHPMKYFSARDHPLYPEYKNTLAAYKMQKNALANTRCA